jgi:hypothetical protein
MKHHSCVDRSCSHVDDAKPSSDGYFEDIRSNAFRRYAVLHCSVTALEGKRREDLIRQRKLSA